MRRNPVTVYNSPGGLEPITLLNPNQYITGFYKAGDLGRDPWAHYWVPATQYVEFLTQSNIFEENVTLGELVHTIYYFPIFFNIKIL